MVSYDMWYYIIWHHIIDSYNMGQFQMRPYHMGPYHKGPHIISDNISYGIYHITHHMEYTYGTYGIS